MAEVVDIEIKVLRLLLCKVKWHQHAIDFIIIYYVFLHTKNGSNLRTEVLEETGRLVLLIKTEHAHANTTTLSKLICLFLLIITMIK